MSKINYNKIPDKERAERLFERRQEHKDRIEREAKLQFDLDLNYRYFRFKSKDSKGVEGVEVSVSVGWLFTTTAGRETVTYAVALQSKKDSFSRKDARRQINKRWESGHTARFTVPIESYRNIDVLIAWHYNSHEVTPEQFGILNFPKYLRRIPLFVR